MLLLVVVAALFAITADAWGDLPKVGDGRLASPPPSSGWATLLGALAFAGAGGGQNLVQSNWIRDKGFGMGALRAADREPGHRRAGGRAEHRLRLRADRARTWPGGAPGGGSPTRSSCSPSCSSRSSRSCSPRCSPTPPSSARRTCRTTSPSCRSEGEVAEGHRRRLVRRVLLVHRRAVAVPGRARHRRLHQPARRRRPEDVLPAGPQREPDLLRPGLGPGRDRHARSCWPGSTSRWCSSSSRPASAA